MTHDFKKLFFGVLSLLLAACLLGEFQLEHIRTIEKVWKGRPEPYIQGAAMTGDKEILVVYAIGNFVAKYKLDGTFVRRLDIMREGIGDTMIPTAITIGDNKAFVIDQNHMRIVEMPLSLKKWRYFKPEAYVAMTPNIEAISDTSLMVTALQKFVDPKSNSAGKIVIMDTEGKIKRAFFNEYPIAAPAKVLEDGKQRFKLDSFGQICWGMDKDKQQLLVSFQNPDNPIKFYLLDFKGNVLNEFEYSLDKQYRFPFQIYEPKQVTMESMQNRHSMRINCIFSYRGFWFVGLEKSFTKTLMDMDTELEYLVFDGNGKYRQSVAIKELVVMSSVTADGFLVGIYHLAPCQKIEIYKITEK